MIEFERMRIFAQGLIDEANHQQDEIGAAGAHEAITVRGVCERILAIIDGAPPLTSVDRIPAGLLVGLERYSMYGIATGSCLRAVLEGDLYAAFRAADPVTTAAMPAIVAYIRDHLQPGAYGSPEAVSRWIALRGESRSHE